MDQTWPSDRPVPHGAIPIRPRPGGGNNNGPALQGGRGNNVNGDDLHLGHRGGGRRNRTRSYNQSESEEELRPYGSSPYGSSPMMSMHQADLGWYHRSLYDQAEAQYQRRLAAGDLSFSPGKSPRGSSRGSVTFQRSKQPGENDAGTTTPAVTVAKSPGTQRRQPFRGRTRTSSETSGGKGSRGPYRRKRGHSETEFRPSKPRWDNANMSGLQCLATETIWFDKSRYDEAERRFYEGQNGSSSTQGKTGQPQAAAAAKGRPKRQHRNSSSHGGADAELISRMKSLEMENSSLHRVVEEMRACLQNLEARVVLLEKSPAMKNTPAVVPVCTKVVGQAQSVTVVEQNGGEDDEDDFELFGSDEEEDAEAERLKQQRVEAYAAKKAKKPALIAKSSILLDVKPWDDETDMAELEKCVRSVEADGLLWGASKLVPVGYGIKKLQISCVVEDDKVGTDLLEEEITKFEDFVQSVDVAAFNKI